MIEERENIFDETALGSLVARSYNISNNDIDAFYDVNGNLIFVLDKTINQNKPNVLLVINPVGDKKWDEILSGQYGVDLEVVRPKQDNKYQKLDIEYSGLGVYKNLIDGFVSGGALNEHLAQLDILRDSAMRHSAMTRLNVANEIITKTNVTIVKTRESIIRLKERLKNLRSRLSEQKKSIGRVPTKQSAAKILKLESMIDSTDEKLKRTEKRLESAQRRLEIANVDAELATNLLNQPNREIKIEKSQVFETPKVVKEFQVAENVEDDDVVEEVENVEQTKVKNEPLVVAPKYEIQKIEPVLEPILESEDEEETGGEKEILEEPKENFDIGGEEMNEEKDVSENSEVKPLLDKDPEIMNEDIAFKPISFDAPELVVPTDDVPIKENDVDGEIFSDDSQKKSVETQNYLDEPLLEDKEEKTPVPEIAEIPNIPEVPAEEESDEDVELDSDFNLEQKPVLDAMKPVAQNQRFGTPEDDVAHEDANVIENSDNTFDVPSMNKEQDLEPVDENHNVDNVAHQEMEKYGRDLSYENKDVEERPEMHRTENLVRPLPPVGVVGDNNKQPAKPVVSYEPQTTKTKSSFVYYFFLLLLIGLSVLTLWLYQKNIGNGKFSFFDRDVVVKQDEQQPTEQFPDDLIDTNFQERPAENPVKPIETIRPMPVQPQPQEDVEPTVINSISDRVSSFSGFQSNEEEPKPEVEVKQEVVVNKPVYDAGTRYDKMFVYEEDQPGVEYVDEQYIEEVPGDDYYEEFVEESDVVYEYVEETDGDEPVEEIADGSVETINNNVGSEVKPAEPQRVVYNGDDIYADDNYYEEGFDEEEAAYQAGYTGYEY